MYGYEALRKGSVLFFEIDIDTVEADMENDIIDNLKSALEGRRHIGRSKTAQYGLVSIKYLKPADEYEEVNSSGKTGDIATVYADGRLIFTDSYGLPKILPYHMPAKAFPMTGPCYLKARPCSMSRRIPCIRLWYTALIWMWKYSAPCSMW